MILRSLAISNLKCFTSLRLDLAPLTLLTGFNSAGKSTALQALLLIAQGLRAAPQSQYLPLNGPLVRLGSAGDVLSNSAKGKRQISVEVATADDEIIWQFLPSGPKTGALQVHTVIHRSSGKNERRWTKRLSVGGRRTVQNGLIRSLEGIVCIGAARGGAGETYPAPESIEIFHADVGVSGEYAPWWYVLAADDEIDESRRHPSESAGSFRRQLDAHLSDLFPGAQATADEIPHTPLVRLGLRVGTTSEWRRPANMGYGLSYVFPILVSLLLARRGQIIIIDSPEAHLHPRAQSHMGQMLARFSAAGVQILIESHSDHLLNGVRLAVKNQTIAPSQVSVHFFQGASEEGGHGVISPVLDREGIIDAWPVGFFDQAEGDLARLAGWA